jgi:protein SCO1
MRAGLWPAETRKCRRFARVQAQPWCFTRADATARVNRMHQKRQRPSLGIQLVLAVVLATAFGIACNRGRQHELRGQIVAIDPNRQEITITHEDIEGFMPGMTMPFKVSDPSLLKGRSVGDLVHATLLVTDTQGVLTAIEQTGHAPLTEPPPARPAAEALRPGDEVPDVELVDETGTTRRLSEWRGRALAITFIYTRCPLPDFCPLMDRQFADVQQIVAADASLRGRVQLLSISFDPEYDTPAVLATHAKKVGADAATWAFLTGTPSDIDVFAAHFGVSVMRDGSDPASVVHNLRTGVVAPDGRLVTIISGMQWAPSELVTGLRSAVGGR